MNLTRSEALEKIDELQLRYIAALDAKKMGDWLGTFSDQPDASYICTTAESLEADLPLALILDDCHARLEDRVTFVTRVWKGTFTDYRTRHFVQRLACRDLGDRLYEVESNFLILYTPADTGRSEVFANGVYIDRIRVDQTGAVFLSKKAVTDAALVQRYIVFPM